MGFLALLPAVMAGTASAGAAASVATGMTMASAGIGAAGAIAGGVSALGQANYQANIAQQNAAALQTQANNTREAGQTAESQQREKVTETIGQQKAAQAANGVDVGVGSAKQVRDSTQTLGDYDALTIRYNAAKAAFGQDTEATNQLAQAKMDKASGKMALAGSFLGAANSLIGGAGKVASMQLMNKAVGAGT